MTVTARPVLVTLSDCSSSGSGNGDGAVIVLSMVAGTAAVLAVSGKMGVLLVSRPAS